MTKLKMVLCGSKQEFYDYLFENKLTESEAKYVADSFSVLGYGHDYDIVEYGTCYRRPDYFALKEYLEKNRYV